MVILFDLDDTLLNQKAAAALAAQAFWREFALQLPYSETAFPLAWWEVMQKYGKLLGEGKLSFQEQRRLRIREIFNQPKISNEEADRRFAIYLRHFEDHWQLFDDVIPCLDSLDGYILGIVTNGNSFQQRQKLERSGIQKYFERVLISEELGCHKPQREIFSVTCRQFGCDPADCIFVGDNLENDVIGPGQAGMHGIWLNRDRHQCADDSILTIHGLGELKTRIGSIMS